MEIKRCDRCGCFFETPNNVCNNCADKDNKELGKLKNFLSGYVHYEEMTVRDISDNTGITVRNINRFLTYKEFSNIQIPHEAKQINDTSTIKI